MQHIPLRPPCLMPSLEPPHYNALPSILIDSRLHVYHKSLDTPISWPLHGQDSSRGHVLQEVQLQCQCQVLRATLQDHICRDLFAPLCCVIGLCPIPLVTFRQTLSTARYSSRIPTGLYRTAVTARMHCMPLTLTSACMDLERLNALY